MSGAATTWDGKIGLLLRFGRPLLQPLLPTNVAERNLRSFHTVEGQNLINTKLRGVPIAKLPEELWMLVLLRLGPWPPLLAVSQTQEILRLMAQAVEPYRDSIEVVQPGVTLWIRTVDFLGVRYLSRISKHLGQQTSNSIDARILVGDRLIIPTDHFGVLDISYAAKKHSRARGSVGPLRYLVIDTDTLNPCNLSVQSDVRLFFHLTNGN